MIMSLINLAVAAVSAWARWRRCRRAHYELTALDDRSLADIGIRRTDIPAIFDEKFRRERVGKTEGAAMALLSSLSFGGFPTVLPDVHNFVTANGWISDREFANFFAISGVVPGPNMILMMSLIG